MPKKKAENVLSDKEQFRRFQKTAEKVGVKNSDGLEIEEKFKKLAEKTACKPAKN